MKKGILLTGSLFMSYVLIEYGLIALTQVIVGALIYAKVDWRVIFLILWCGNVIISRSIIFANDKSEVDFTLMGKLKKITDYVIERAYCLGIIIKAIITLPVIWWVGAVGFVILWNTKSKTLLVLVSGLQMLFWTRIYVFGYQVTMNLLGGPHFK